MMQAMNQTTTRLNGQLMEREPLARYTSWRVGGFADRMYKPSDIEDVQNYLRSLPSDESVLWLGLGSNVLIRDGGIRGSVIYTRGCLNQMCETDDGMLYVEAGVPCALVAKLAAENNLSGAEFLAGIPGTMGGALAMNAGAFGGETWGLVNKVLLVNRQGDLIERQAAEFDVGYRSVSVAKDEWFVACYLAIPAGGNQQSREKIRQLLVKRAETQPTKIASGGSVFKNPQGYHAARLIEELGLKGKQIGGAQVSEKHSNFILNTGDASAEDIERLIEFVKKEVQQKQGTLLQTEVHILGEALEQ
ncbi:MAG: UDP-N-acetylenolpyruvoylglucosamine reductase [Cycloclasticus sp. symbiont of Poecilosclerida sp. N]|nr:MAG: UDP-N-acetylenolpyruvoylglucosamine reductase [Cycloclasticus sp. symbiont of Poecilosclerida sp. N]